MKKKKHTNKQRIRIALYRIEMTRQNAPENTNIKIAKKKNTTKTKQSIHTTLLFNIVA